MSQDDESLAAEVSDELGKVFFGEYDRIRKPTNVPERLYHFCDANAMASIIQRRTLWASLSTCLNDASEVVYGLNRARSIIESRLAKPSSFLRHTKKLVNAAMIQPYVACFCPSADEALHWLHYGRAGSGVALGFDGPQLVHGDQFILAPAIYDVATFDAQVNDALDRFEQVFAKLRPEMMPHSALAMEKFAANLMSIVLGGMVASVKNPAFAAEHEWRLVCTEMDADWVPDEIPKAPDKDMRTSGGRVVPYRKVEYTAANFPLREIVLGHSCAVQENDPGLSVLLRQYFKKGSLPTVRRSDIPVRS